jgi:hypothetical protein
MNSQLQQLLMAYGITAAGMLVSLLVMRADARAYWRWPVYSAMVMALGVVSWNLLRSHLIPARWVLLHADALYYGALVLYALFGIVIGALLGRLTRGKTDSEVSTQEQNMNLPGPRPPPND